MSNPIDYETDFYAWALHNAQLLREGKLSEIDIEHIAEELETMGKNNQRELTSRLKILLGHLLKWQYQADYRGRSWRGSIIEQRSEIKDLLEENPSLKPILSQTICLAYPKAVNLASEETGLSKNTFPQTCPYSQEQILQNGFYPDHD
jgi:hypothetical protein